ncbi:MAG: hypothetical protein AAF602_12290 [Myxococcota bacterium]
MPDGELNYSFRVAHPDMLQRGRASQRVRLEVSRDGALVAPDAASTFSLIRPDGTAVIDAQTITLDGSVAVYDITVAQLVDDDTNPYSELYQERWALTLPDGTVRIIRREAAVAPFDWYNPVSTTDLTEGEYPNLAVDVGPDLTLQPFIDEAVRHVLELLWQRGQWPQIMVSASAFRKPIRERALFLVFKLLYRNASGVNRWEVLMNHHEGEWNAAWSGLNSRIDADLDGLADTRDRSSAARAVHRNVPPFRTRRRTPRW